MDVQDAEGLGIEIPVQESGIASIHEGPGLVPGRPVLHGSGKAVSLLQQEARDDRAVIDGLPLLQLHEQRVEEHPEEPRAQCGENQQEQPEQHRGLSTQSHADLPSGLKQAPGVSQERSLRTVSRASAFPVPKTLSPP